VLGTVSRCVNYANRDGAGLELLPVFEPLEGKLRLGQRMDGDGHIVLEGEASMSGNMVCVGMRLEDTHDPNCLVVGGFQVLLDRVGGIDDERLARRGVADQVGGAAEIVVDELAKQHERTLTPALASFLEALSARVGLLFVVLWALAWPGTAWAHARLIRSVPGNEAVLATAPTSVRLLFDDAVRARSGMKAIRNGDGSVLAGKPHVVGGRTLVVPLRAGLADGDYTVLWRVLSNDGHEISGTIAFGVGAARAPPQAALSADNGPSAQNVLARLLFFAGLLTAVGSAFFRFVVASVPVRLLLVSFLLVFVGISGQLHDVSVSTRFGTAMAVAAGLAGFGALIAALVPVFPRLEPLPFVVALALLPIPTVAGHALDRGRSWLEIPVDLLHVAAASVWLGGLVGLVLLLRGQAGRHLPLRRFSNLALAAVAALAVTGVIRAFSELRSVSQLWSTGYGRVLLVKTVLLALLVTLGWLNRYRLVPRLSLAGLRRNVALELVLFAGLVAAVGLLTDLRPGRDRIAQAAVTEAKGPPPPPAQGMVVQAREAGNYGVALGIRPPRAEVVVLGQDGNGVNRLAVTINGSTTQQCGAGCYAAALPATRRVQVMVGRAKLVFQVPKRHRSGDAILARATRAFRALRSVDYVERLASSPRDKVVSDFTLERPNRLEYRIKGGASGIIIGSRRWDRVPGGKWIPSAQEPTPQPEPIWSGHATNVYVLQASASTYVVSFFKPNGPVWFTVLFDRRTLLPRELHMTAAAHFMTHRYTKFNAPRRIRAPAA
jgi:copper transport protein